MGFKHYKCWFDSDLPSGNFLQFAIENDPFIDDLQYLLIAWWFSIVM